MSQNSRGKKTPEPQGLTRVGLTRALGVGLTSVDRLIAFGLKSIGHQGPAKLYALSAARALARRLAPVETVAADVLIGDYRSHAEDLHDRRQSLRDEWIAESAWRPAWARFVAAAARHTARWPAILATRVGGTPREQASRLFAADGPRPAPPRPRRYLGPDEVRARLAGDPAAAPWPPAARPRLAHLVEQGHGVELVEDGTWYEWDPARGIPASPSYPEPMMRPLLAGLVAALGRDPAARALGAALAPPPREPLPAAPQSADEARAQWREARAAYRRARVAVRRGHRRREALHRTITAAVEQCKWTWWGWGRLAAHAGDPAAAREAAERLHREALDHLRALDPTTRRRPRATKGATP